MSQQIRKRTQKIMEYSANNKIAESLGRGMVYRELMLRLRGQPTITAANNTQAKTLNGDEWACVRRIDLIANNTEVIKSFNGADLWWWNLWWYGNRPPTTPTLGDGATANPAFDSTLILPLWMPRAIRPIDTALDARTLSDLKIEVTWGSELSINGDATAWTVEPSLQVASLEAFNIQGEFSQWRLFPIEKEVVADNPNFQIFLPVGPMYRSFLIHTTDDGADVDTIINNFRWVSGSTTFADQPAKMLHQVEPIRTLRGELGQLYAAGTNLRRSDQSSPKGWFYYDHVTDGFNSEAIDTLGFSEINLELDVSVGSGTSKVIVYPSTIIPVRGGSRRAA